MLELLIEAAIQAPSAINEQPWDSGAHSNKGGSLLRRLTHALAHGLANVNFEVGRAQDFDGRDFDLITCFDCLHDMGYSLDSRIGGSRPGLLPAVSEFLSFGPCFLSAMKSSIRYGGPYFGRDGRFQPI